MTCEQNAPGEDIDVTITDTVTDPSHTPTTNVTGGPIAGGVKPYFVTGFISIWMPNPPDDTSVESVNTYTPLQTTSVSGAQNFPGGSEPTADNSAKRNIVEYAAGGASKYLYRDVDDGAAIEDGSAKQGDPWVTEGAALHSVVEAWNNGLAPYDDAILCDTFDRSTQRLHRVKGNAATWSGFQDATSSTPPTTWPPRRTGRSGPVTTATAPGTTHRKTSRAASTRSGRSGSPVTSPAAAGSRSTHTSSSRTHPTGPARTTSATPGSATGPPSG